MISFKYLYYLFIFSRKDDIFNLKIVNWGNENMMSSKVEVKKHDFNSTDILNVDGLQQTKLEVNELVESSHIDECDNGHTIAEHHPAPLSKSTKRHIKNGKFFIIDILIILKLNQSIFFKY